MLSDPVPMALAQEKPIASTTGQNTLGNAKPTTARPTKRISEVRRGTKRQANEGDETKKRVRIQNSLDDLVINRSISPDEI